MSSSERALAVQYSQERNNIMATWWEQELSERPEANEPNEARLPSHDQSAKIAHFCSGHMRVVLLAAMPSGRHGKQ